MLSFFSRINAISGILLLFKTVSKGACNHDRTKGVAKFVAAYRTSDDYTVRYVISYLGPVSALIWSSLPSFLYYKSGIYSDTACSLYRGKYDHAVNIVGYGTSANGINYWIVRNSWGTSWGQSGYIFMQRNTLSNCGIGAYVVFGTA